MAIHIRPAKRKRIKKAKTGNSQEILHRIEEYLENECDEPVEILCGLWKDQQNAITYQEIRQIIVDGTVNQETVDAWRQDYSVMVNNKLQSMWTNAISAGASSQPVLDGVNFEFNTQTTGILNWISERGAELVTSSTQEQKNAIASLITYKMKEGHTVDELSRLIRPCIGLTEGQAKANAKYYDSIVSSLTKDHPRMKQENIRRKALEASQKYAEKQHRYRAFTIAQTESAYAYNRGADEGIRQAQAAGYLGNMKKRWCTSGDDGVCDTCAALEGTEIGMDENFKFKGRIKFTGQDLLPPAHPRCACAVEYIEDEDTEFIPQYDVPITGSNSLREYTDEEIENIAEQTDRIASKYIDTPSKWSGKIMADDKSEVYGKLWSCDILTTHETSPHIILHEQIHARSISYYDAETYIQFKNIEEASVQFINQEICKNEGIEIIQSEYDDMVDALRKIGNRISTDENDLIFAKKLIEMPVTDRISWIEDNLYDTLRINGTLEEYEDLSTQLNKLY